MLVGAVGAIRETQNSQLLS